MKIKYVVPFELTQTLLEADTETDFLSINVGTVGYTESNKFLVAFWNQLNVNICPKHSIGRVPWAYYPGKYRDKKKAVSVIGFANTSIGELYFALQYKTKGNIDALLVMKPYEALKRDEEKQLRKYVDNALAEKDRPRMFLCEAPIALAEKGVTMYEYKTEAFSVTPNSDGGFLLSFNIAAIDKFEAEQAALGMLYDICAFFTVETNILCCFDKLEIKENIILSNSSERMPFVNDYIDNYPLNRNKLYLSEYGLRFIVQHILGKNRFEERSSIDRYFLSACKHVQIGMEAENKVGSMPVTALPTMTFSLNKRDQRNKEEHMTSALMSYLSAMECVTAGDGQRETCSECGAVKYKIAQRVKDLATKYLGEHLGKVFNKLYSYRSKFLHEGRFASESNMIRTIPLLSKTSATGLDDYGKISVSVEGGARQIDIANVKEWTTYTLRCFYQERIMGRTSFKDVFDNPDKSTLPIKLQALSPVSSQLMRKIFVSTDTFKYKVKRILKDLVDRVKYRIYKFKRS